MECSVTITTLLPSLCSAKSLSPERKKRVALEVISGRKTTTQAAKENNTSRKYIRQQSKNARIAIDKQFNIDQSNNDAVIYYLPVTKMWIMQLVLALMFLGFSSYRNIVMILKDLFDYDISIGTINNMFAEAVEKARVINAAEDLSNINVTANDELFHHNKPILSGIDVRSLYCYLLTSEDHRDEETWAIHLMDAQDKGLNPQRTLGDDAGGLVSGHKITFPETPYDYDNFHLSQSLMDLRRYFRNRLKTAITERNTLEIKAKKYFYDDGLADKALIARAAEDNIRHLSTTLDTLISWLEHDILNKAGPTIEERRKLYDFIVEEFKKLEAIESNRIRAMRITLENKKEAALNFTTVLNEEFTTISQKYKLSINILWELCKLQRCDVNNNQYYIRSMPLRIELKNLFTEIETAVIEAMESTERTSSMIENLNGRVRKYISYREEIGYGFLDLLRFFLNHKPIERSAKTERKGKTPAEILSRKSHPHWLELLGFERFKRAA